MVVEDHYKKNKNKKIGPSIYPVKKNKKSNNINYFGLVFFNFLIQQKKNEKKEKKNNNFIAICYNPNNENKKKINKLKPPFLIIRFLFQVFKFSHRFPANNNNLFKCEKHLNAK